MNLYREKKLKYSIVMKKEPRQDYKKIGKWRNVSRAEWYRALLMQNRTAAYGMIQQLIFFFIKHLNL